MLIDENNFTNIDYCDLEIVSLKILSNSDWDKKNVSVVEFPRSGTPIINVYLCKDDPIEHSHLCESYREKKMQEGFYVGHHFGSPVFMQIIDDLNIVFCCSEPGKIIWSYLFKLVLTLYARKRNMLHIKASCIEYKGKSFVVLGRGGAGKTEFVRILCKCGARLMGNTHALVDDGKVFGIQSNIRIRVNGKDQYISIRDQCDLPLFHDWANLGAIFWLQYRTDGQNIIRKLPELELYHNMRWFSEAVANWELKEDIADYVDSDPFRFSNYVHSIDEKIKELCRDSLAYYLNVDINSISVQERVLELMNRVCSE